MKRTQRKLTCLICRAEYVFEDHHRCLYYRGIDLTDREKESGYRPSRREYYREYMRKSRADENAKVEA